MFRTIVRIRKFVYLARGKCLSVFLRMCGCKVGAGLKCRKWPDFRQLPYRNISIGNDVTIGRRITFDVHCGGKLIIGDNVTLTQDVVISVCDKITIGRFSMIGEYVSIRDADHGVNPDEYICKQKLQASGIDIGDDVWIAAGCRILKGTTIPSGCVIAANAVVTNRSIFDKDLQKGIYAGVPAVLKKIRT